MSLNTKCKLKKKFEDFINNFIISKYDESFSKRARPTNKIHLWEHLFKFANFYDFRLSFFFFHQKQEKIRSIFIEIER